MIDMEAVERACEDVRRHVKTDAMIRTLAESRYTWDQDDADRAVREADCEPFSAEDILFVKELIGDPGWWQRERILREISNWMIENDLEKRKEIFRKEFRPKLDEINEYRRGIAAKYSGLVFYRHFQEGGENSENRET